MKNKRGKAFKEEVSDPEEKNGEDNKSGTERTNELAGPPIKKQKVYSSLYKPPTSEELNMLKETLGQHHSHFFKLQMDELYTEMQINETKVKHITDALHDLRSILENLKSQHVANISNTSCLPKTCKVPLKWSKSQLKGEYTFLKPTEVNVVGSFHVGTCSKPNVNIDVAVKIPLQCLQPKDFLNFRYHHKRALYCSFLAKNLRKADRIEEVLFSKDDHLRPIVLLKITGKSLQNVVIRLHPCLPDGAFKLSRFGPNKSNIRKQWYTGDESKEEIFPITPYYNASILSDMCLETHMQCIHNASHDFPGFKLGLCLLKVWLHQRELDKGQGSFSGFIMSMLLVYLLEKKKINRQMNGYYVMRNTFLYLAQSKWTLEGISLNPISQSDDLPSLQSFHDAFDVVFVDSTGYLNICANMMKCVYEQVKHEAQLALGYLDSSTLDSFSALFITPVPFVRKFDQIIHVRDISQLADSCRMFKLDDTLMNHAGCVKPTVINSITDVLHQGLGERVKLISVRLSSTPQWSIKQCPPEGENLTIGVILDPDHSQTVLDKGPFANSPQAAEFRKFWGEKAELRRFQDGSICEAVLWPGKTIAEKRRVCHHQIRHILHRHAGIKPETLVFAIDDLEHLLQPLTLSFLKTSSKEEKSASLSTRDEENLAVMAAFTSLGKCLRQMKDLPLTITSVQGISAVFRYTEVFPPSTANIRKYARLPRVNDYVQAPSSEKICPEWVPVLEVICQLEGSGKWPSNLEALQRVKTAFYIKMADLLHKQYNLVTSATVKYLDILKDGHVFRIEVANQKEIGILKESRNAQGILIHRDNKQSQELERRMVSLPRLTSYLYGIQQQYGVYGPTARLVKRWISSQLMIDFISVECLDLIVAQIFLQPEPNTVPSSPVAGFVRFLKLLATHDWKHEPLIVNLNNELRKSDYDEIKGYFSKRKESFPPMYIATPADRSSMWTTNIPSEQILEQLKILAEESLKILEEKLTSADGVTDIKQIFRPPLECYDVILHLRKKVVPRWREAVDAEVHESEFGPNFLNDPSLNQPAQLPVVNFDPVRCYVSELRETFGSLGLFFHDIHGGDCIAVLWKPPSFIQKPIKVSELTASMPKPGSDSCKAVGHVVPNIEAILSDFQIMGRGLLKSIEVRTDRWKV